MKRKPLSSIVGTILILTLGLLLITIALSTKYITLMHPRYRVVTLLGGIVLSSSSLALFRKTNVHMTIPSALLLGMSILFISMTFYRENVGSGFLRFAKVPQEKATSIRYDHLEYTKISLPELMMLTEDIKNGRNDLIGKNIAIQAKIHLPSHVTTENIAGETAGKTMGASVSRVTMFCCLADALRIMYSLQLPEKWDTMNNGLSEGFIDGNWVGILGRIEEIPSELQLPSPESFNFDGPNIFSVQSKKFQFIADFIEIIEEPIEPFVFYLSMEEPFNF